ncbi:MAG: flagellar export protein FliJ [Thermodesulfobacteriota bacterium]
MRYSFKFEALLNYKKRLEEVAQQVLAQKMTELAEAEQKLDQLKTREEECLAELIEKRIKGIPVARHLLYINYLNLLAKDIAMHEEVVQALIRAVEEARQKLLKSSREKKMIEKLKKKDFDAFTQELIRLEQKENDELVLIRRQTKDAFSEGPGHA